MASVDNLQPDQRAVLQMVLQRGRSYDEIANMLGIDRDAVRQRALDALDALTPMAVLPGPERALVTDYLLGQLPAMVAEQVLGYLEASESDREWGLALSRVLAPLAPGDMPEIPLGAPLGADRLPGGGPPGDRDAVEPDLGAAVELDDEGDDVGDDEGALEADEETSEPSRATPASTASLWLWGGLTVAIIAAVVVVVVLTSASSAPRHKNVTVTHPTVTGPTTTGTRTTPTRTTPTGTRTTPELQRLALLHLSSPAGALGTIGVAQVVRDHGVDSVVITAQGVPANTAHDAYAVWLSNSLADSLLIGWVPSVVGRSGLLSTEGTLPARAYRFHHILITLETQAKPTEPGEVVLSGVFRERS